jgi:hypothetical protein
MCKLVCGALYSLHTSRSFELRLKKSWNTSSQHLDGTVIEEQPMWVICSIFPELNDEGEVIEIVGCCTDIRYVSTLT